MLTPTIQFTPAAAATPAFNTSNLSFSYTTPTSMVLTLVIFLIALFFIGFFSIFARRFFAGPAAGAAADHRGPSPFVLDDSPSPTVAHRSSNRRYFFPYPPAGLDPAAVRALPVLTYAGVGGKEGCVVCLGELEAGERVKVIPGCGHAFHACCIDGWLLLHGSCPICRCSQLWAPRAAARSYEVFVNIDDGGGDAGEARAEERSSDSDEEVEDSGGGGEEGRRKRAGLKRSRSFISNSGGGEGEGGRVFLRRTCSL